MTPAPVPPRWRAPVLSGLFLGALALRLFGIDFGTPLTSNYYVRPDESLIVETALRAGEDPRFFFYPALMPLFCGALFRLYHVGASIFSISIPGELATHAGLHLERFFLLARLVSALAGAALVAAVCRAASLLSSDRAGFFAAALAATSPLAVREAHFGVTDTLLALVVSLVLVLIAAPAPAGRRRAWLLAMGTLLGLAAAAKYPGAFLAPAVAVSVFSSSASGRRLRDLAIVFSAAAAVFVTINPYLFWHLPELASTARILTGAIYERPDAAGGWSVAEGIRNLARPLRWGPGLVLGPVLAAIGILGTVADRSRRAGGIVGVVAMAGFGLPLLVARAVPFRYVLPLVPIVAVWAGVGLDRSFSESASRIRRVAGPAVASALVALSLWTSIRLDRLLSRIDTRALAGAWILSRVPVSCPILFRGLPETEPQLVESVTSLERRTTYVHRLYGPVAGEIVSRLYRLEVAARRDVPGNSGGYEVYRNEVPPVETPCLCVVSGSYAGFGGLPENAEVAAAARRGRTTGRSSFSPFEVPADRAPLESFDAFFLPMSALARFERPGPVLEVELKSRR